MEGYETKGGDVPRVEDLSLKIEVGCLAALQQAPGVAASTDGGLDERRKIPAADEDVLDGETGGNVEIPRPLGVYLALEIESSAFVGYVAGDDEKAKGDPEE